MISRSFHRLDGIRSLLELLFIYLLDDKLDKNIDESHNVVPEWLKVFAESFALLLSENTRILRIGSFVKIIYQCCSLIAIKK